MDNKQAKCPVCGWRGLEFLTYDGGYGQKVKNTACPVCNSHPRHRQIFLYLSTYLNLKLHTAKSRQRRLKVLHFSPSLCLFAYLKNWMGDLDYLTVDIVPGMAMRTEDITHLSFADNLFELIICVHVLEHVEYDRIAIQEIKRVLKPGGKAIIDVPMDTQLAVTYEDPLLTTPEERAKAYWQFDHVRLYGRDFPDRLSREGFVVKVYRYREMLHEDAFKLYGLYDLPLFVCTK